MSSRFTWSLFFLLAIFALALAALPGVRRAGTVGGCCRTAAALPATSLGSVSFNGGAVNVVLNQDTAYACGANAVGIVDISNPQSPNLLGTFGTSDLNGNAISGCFQVGQSLVIPVNVQTGLVYDISNRRSLRSNAQFTPSFPFSGYVSFLGNVGWFTTDSFTYDVGSRAIQTQSGAFFAIDFSTPNSPAAVGNLAPNSSQPASANNAPR